MMCQTGHGHRSVWHQWIPHDSDNDKETEHSFYQGIPDAVISDNGWQYTSQEFQKFSRLWGFQHKTSSPGYLQSNGKAESAVKTAKRFCSKPKAPDRILISTLWTIATHQHTSKIWHQSSIVASQSLYQNTTANENKLTPAKDCAGETGSRKQSTTSESLLGQLKTWTHLPQVTMWECSLCHPALSRE